MREEAQMLQPICGGRDLVVILFSAPSAETHSLLDAVCEEEDLRVWAATSTRLASVRFPPVKQCLMHSIVTIDPDEVTVLILVPQPHSPGSNVGIGEPS